MYIVQWATKAMTPSSRIYMEARTMTFVTHCTVNIKGRHNVRISSCNMAVINVFPHKPSHTEKWVRLLKN